MNEPLISIITVVYNGASTLEQTVLSVIYQTYSNIEYIIIDGGSTDGTVDIIRKYEDKISYWVSEPDRGIYDAMNKGIDKASGDWVNFMNSGDCFYNNAVINDIFHSGINKSVTVLYGDILSIFSFGNFLFKASPLSQIEREMVFSHQSTFVRRNILAKYHFDISFKISADYNLFYNLYKKGYQFQYIPICIAFYEAEKGISSVNGLVVYKENCRINGMHKIEYYKVFIKKSIRACILIIFPKTISNKILIKWLHCKKYVYTE